MPEDEKVAGTVRTQRREASWPAGRLGLDDEAGGPGSTLQRFDGSSLPVEVNGEPLLTGAREPDRGDSGRLQNLEDRCGEPVLRAPGVEGVGYVGGEPREASVNRAGGHTSELPSDRGRQSTADSLCCLFHAFREAAVGSPHSPLTFRGRSPGCAGRDAVPGRGSDRR